MENGDVMTWDHDISRAPRGRYVIETRRIKDGKTADHRVFERDVIWLASKCGKVMRSYYLPEEKRWCMFSASEKPVAWMAYDEARDAYEVEENGKTVTRYRCPLAHPYASLEAA